MPHANNTLRDASQANTLLSPSSACPTPRKKTVVIEENASDDDSDGTSSGADSDGTEVGSVDRISGAVYSAAFSAALQAIDSRPPSYDRYQALQDIVFCPSSPNPIRLQNAPPVTPTASSSTRRKVKLSSPKKEGIETYVKIEEVDGETRFIPLSQVHQTVHSPTAHSPSTRRGKGKGKGRASVV